MLNNKTVLGPIKKANSLSTYHNLNTFRAYTVPYYRKVDGAESGVHSVCGPGCNIVDGAESGVHSVCVGQGAT